MTPALAENGLLAKLPQIARLAIRRGFAQIFQVWLRRDEGRGGLFLLFRHNKT
jgi:hypothetical protein